VARRSSGTPPSSPHRLQLFPLPDMPVETLLGTLECCRSRRMSVPIAVSTLPCALLRYWDAEMLDLVVPGSASPLIQVAVSPVSMEPPLQGRAESATR